MSLRRELAENRWLRAQFAVLVLVAAYMPVMVALLPAWGLIPTAVLALAGGVCWVGAHRAEKALPAAVEPPRWTVRVPNPAPNQCPVCGLDDLKWWREVDVFTLREDDERHVQPYGPYQAAHRFCAELVPYVEPAPRGACSARLTRMVGRTSMFLDLDRRVEPGVYRIASNQSGDHYVTIAQLLTLGAVCTVKLAGPFPIAAPEGTELQFVGREKPAAARPVRDGRLRRSLTAYWEAENRRLAEDVSRLAAKLETELSPPFYTCTCRKCGEIGRAKTIAGRDAVIEAHRKSCWKTLRVELRDRPSR